MDYKVEISRRAMKDLRKVDAQIAKRLLLKIADLKQDLNGDVKRLTDFEPEYRLRIGDYRILFDVDGSDVIVRRIKNRREAY